MTGFPLPVVDAPVDKDVRPLAFHAVVVEVTCVLDACAGFVAAVAVLASLHELALVPRTIGPFLHAGSALLILGPLSLVGGAVDVAELAAAMGSVLVPLAVVGVPVGGLEGAVALGHAVGELALVHLSILFLEDTSAVPDVAQPLALVQGAVLYLVLRFLHQVRVLLSSHCRWGRHLRGASTPRRGGYYILVVACSSGLHPVGVMDFPIARAVVRAAEHSDGRRQQTPRLLLWHPPSAPLRGEAATDGVRAHARANNVGQGSGP
mmetsp:Transcript_99081/g.258853  ORF Transcript_99081/g.258853 Transcript_99081/m.258853 type:complete len:264 (+) Transcript_99081:330-1121(+)